MQQQDWNKNYTTRQLERVPLKSTVKVQMPKPILHKIKFLCRAIPKVEWSGILLYSVEGSIKNPKKMVITLQDIIPMNKGSQAYTEYNFNEKKRDTSEYEDRHIDYCMEHPEALEWRIGHIHSHNSMNVFFSGTDMSELDDNSASHDFYLSLIVNNWMDFCAKVAFRGSVKKKIKEKYLASDEDGKMYPVETSELDIVKEKLYIYDCDIDIPKEEKLMVDTLFANNVTDIIEKAKKPVVTTYQGYGYGQGAAVKTPNSNIPSVTPKVTGFTQAKAKQKPTDVVKGFVDDIPYGDLAGMDLDIEQLSEVEEFVVTLLRGTNPPDEQVSSIELALEEIDAFTEEISPVEVSQNIMGNYPVVFEKCFEKRVDDDSYFIEVTEEVINILEEYEVHYEFLSNTIMALKYMVKKYEEYATI